MTDHKSNPSPAQSPAHVREPSVMLSDITADLLWPRVMRAPALALAPSRLITGTICAFLLSIIFQLTTYFKPEQGQEATGFYAQLHTVLDQFNHSMDALANSLFNLNPLGFVNEIALAAALIRNTVMESPIIALIIGLPLIAILSIIGGAISRSAAVEFSSGRYSSNDDTLGFALARARQFVGAVVGPIVACMLIFLLIAVGGLLLSAPVLDVVGSILYLPALILGTLATVVLMLHVIALPMIVPALAVEGTDAFDAIQRSYAYVISKPLRYLLYTLLLFTLGVLSAAVFKMIAVTSIEMTNWGASFFESQATNRALTGEGDLGATKTTAFSIIQIWRTILELIVAGYAISLFFSSSTLLYLVVRRFSDGQDMNEVWDGVGE